MIDNLACVERTLQLVKAELQVALASATAVEALPLLRLIQSAAALASEAQQLREAATEDRGTQTLRGAQQISLALPWPTNFRAAS